MWPEIECTYCHITRREKQCIEIPTCLLVKPNRVKLAPFRVFDALKLLQTAHTAHWVSPQLFYTIVRTRNTHYAGDSARAPTSLACKPTEARASSTCGGNATASTAIATSLQPNHNLNQEFYKKVSREGCCLPWLAAGALRNLIVIQNCPCHSLNQHHGGETMHKQGT